MSPLHVTTRTIALVLMIAGVLSVVLNGPLAKLDTLVMRGGPFAAQQHRLRTSERIVLVTGLAMVALALVLVAVR